MSIYTAVISRELSAKVGKSNGRLVGQVVQLIPGDKKIEFDSKKAMKSMFYWKSVTLTDAERDIISMALSSPHYDDDGELITYPKKTVTLDSFSVAEKNTLGVRGEIPAKLGGTLTNVNFIITID